LVPAGARLEPVAEGFSWVEGPVWDRRAGVLLFSDIPQNAVYRWAPGSGVRLFLRPSGYTGPAPFAGREPGSNGLTLDRLGRLVLAEHGDRRIARLEPDGTKTTLVDRYQGRRLNSPNDLVFRSNGDLYFTDPPFGLPETFDDPARELPFSGIFRLSASGALSLLTSALRAPNGLAFSPDERVLFVSNADRARAVWIAYDVRKDGRLGPGRLFFDATARARATKGAPDGLKADREGHLFAAGPGGIYVLAPDGTHLGSLETGGVVSNVAWGEDGSVLYVTADTAIYRIRLSTRGAGF
jgi:gluconolactonase